MRLYSFSTTGTLRSWFLLSYLFGKEEFPLLLWPNPCNDVSDFLYVLLSLNHRALSIRSNPFQRYCSTVDHLWQAFVKGSWQEPHQTTDWYFQSPLILRYSQIAQDSIFFFLFLYNSALSLLLSFLLLFTFIPSFSFYPFSPTMLASPPCDYPPAKKRSLGSDAEALYWIKRSKHNHQYSPGAAPFILPTLHNTALSTLTPKQQAPFVASPSLSSVAWETRPIDGLTKEGKTNMWRPHGSKRHSLIFFV